MSSKDNPSYCSYLWQGLSLHDGENLYPCCRFELPSPSPFALETKSIEENLNSDFYKNIRQRALQGLKNSECQKCYIEEQHGIISERLNGLGEPPVSFQSTTTSIENIRHLEAFVGRICNLKCHSCHPQVSSKWEEDYHQAQWQWQRPVELNVDYARLVKSMTDLRHIKIIGGEPALSKKTLEILSSVDQIRCKNITLEISTNGTHLFSSEVLNLLTKFRKVSFNISLDGYREINEMIRFPSQWPLIEKNVESYIQWAQKNKAIDIILHCTASSLNVFSLHLMEDWWLSKTLGQNEKNFSSRYAILTTPESMCIKHLPPSLKQLALEKLPPEISKFSHIRSFLLEKTDHDPFFFRELLTYCRRLDEIRNTRISEVIPELLL